FFHRRISPLFPLGGSLNKTSGFPQSSGLITSFIFDNTPPDCTLANAEPTDLLPAGKSFRPVAVQGVPDEDGDAVAITITSIEQDEAVMSEGKKRHFRGDGIRIGTDTGLLRAGRGARG